MRQLFGNLFFLTAVFIAVVQYIAFRGDVSLTMGNKFLLLLLTLGILVGSLVILHNQTQGWGFLSTGLSLIFCLLIVLQMAFSLLGMTVTLNKGENIIIFLYGLAFGAYGIARLVDNRGIGQKPGVHNFE
jgi:hypothetical protein